MRTDNMTTWANGLLTTTDKQADGTMCRQFASGRKEFCCLGWGSTLVPNMPIRWEDANLIGKDPDFHYEIGFGEAGTAGLAPIEFMEWLGYDMSEVENRSGAWDVFIDFPEGLRVRPDYDTRGEALDHESPYFTDAVLMRTNMTCASLNDSGFTFAQIGDLLLYFGITDEINPNKVTDDDAPTPA